MLRTNVALPTLVSSLIGSLSRKATTKQHAHAVYESLMSHTELKDVYADEPTLGPRYYLEKLRDPAFTMADQLALAYLEGLASAISRDIKGSSLDPIPGSRLRVQHMLYNAQLVQLIEALAVLYSFFDEDKRGPITPLRNLSSIMWRVVPEKSQSKVTYLDLSEVDPAWCNTARLELHLHKKSRVTEFDCQRLVYHALVAALRLILHIPPSLSKRESAWFVCGVYETLGPDALYSPEIYEIFNLSNQYTGAPGCPTIDKLVPIILALESSALADPSSTQRQDLAFIRDCAESPVVPGHEQTYRVDQLPCLSSYPSRDAPAPDHPQFQDRQLPPSWPEIDPGRLLDSCRAHITGLQSVNLKRALSAILCGTWFIGTPLFLFLHCCDG